MTITPTSELTVLERLTKTPQYAEEALRCEISEAIFTAMEKAKVSRAELARRLSTSRANVTQMLQGNNNFEVATLARVAFALGIEWQLTARENRSNK